MVCKSLYQLVVACAFVGARCPRDLSCSALFLIYVFHDGSVELFFSFSFHFCFLLLKNTQASNIYSLEASSFPGPRANGGKASRPD